MKNLEHFFLYKKIILAGIWFGRFFFPAKISSFKVNEKRRYFFVTKLADLRKIAKMSVILSESKKCCGPSISRKYESKTCLRKLSDGNIIKKDIYSLFIKLWQNQPLNTIKYIIFILFPCWKNRIELHQKMFPFFEAKLW